MMASDELWKEIPRETPSPIIMAKENKPLYFLKSISVQNVLMLPSRQIPTCEKVIFKLSMPIDCVREIAVLHYFDAEPILLTVAV